MTSTDLNPVKLPLPEFVLFRHLKAVLVKVKHRQDMKATEAQLRRLSDRELNDIGIHRGMIPDIVAGMPRNF